MYSDLLFVENVILKSEEEKIHGFSLLGEHILSYPKELCVNVIYPQLLDCLSHENGKVAPHILSSVLLIASYIENDKENQMNKIMPHVVRLFKSTDRSTRIFLLQVLIYINIIFIFSFIFMYYRKCHLILISLMKKY